MLQMAPEEIQYILQMAFDRCDQMGHGLDLNQQTILLQTITAAFTEKWSGASNTTKENPLTQLQEEERQALFNFIDQQESQGKSWKLQLLNDWLNGVDSGTVQFIRVKYGLSWLDQVQPIHINAYRDQRQLTIGDRIEVSNTLWEWVQEAGPCTEEWFACTVIDLIEIEESPTADINPNAQSRCIVRFDNGMEYEIQGIYDWNRYKWRFPKA
jgi:hypothetical protein